MPMTEQDENQQAVKISLQMVEESKETEEEAIESVFGSMLERRDANENQREVTTELA